MSDATVSEHSVAALGRAVAVLSQTEDLSTLFDVVGDEVAQVVPYHTLRLFLVDEDQGELYPVAIRSSVDDADLADLDDPRFRLPLGKGVTGTIAAEGQAVVVYDLEAHPAAFHIPDTPRVEESMIGVPLTYADRRLGVLTLSKHGLSQFSEQQLTLIEVLGVTITAAIEHRRSIDAEQEALRRQQDLNDLHTTFLANVSHELRTPLTTIGGFLELAVGRTDESLEPLLEGAHRGAARLQALIDDLLEIAAVESGRQDLAPERLEVAAAVAAAVRRAGVEPERVDRSGLVGVVAFADEVRLVTILAELLENADKYGPSGGRITVTARRDEDEVVVDVTDEGDGVPPEHRDALFARFTQGDGSTTRARGGTGMGLSLARVLARWHGGDLVHVPDRDHTTFRLTLPLDTAGEDGPVGTGRSDGGA